MIIDIVLAIISIILCKANELIKYQLSGVIGVISVCYFKDFMGSIAFVALVNIAARLCLQRTFQQAKHIIVLMLFAGFVWEFLMPFIRTTTTDLLDIVAYVLGGLSYCLLIKIITRTKCRDILTE